MHETIRIMKVEEVAYTMIILDLLYIIITIEHTTRKYSTAGY